MALKPESFREVKRLQLLGFIETTQRGSHVKFVSDAGGVVDTVIVPRKPEIPIGTLRSILSQAHPDPAEWNSLD